MPIKNIEDSVRYKADGIFNIFIGMFLWPLFWYVYIVRTIYSCLWYSFIVCILYAILYYIRGLDLCAAIVYLYRTYNLYYLVLHASSDFSAVYLYYFAALTQILRAPCSAKAIGDSHHFPPPADPQEPMVALLFRRQWWHSRFGAC